MPAMSRPGIAARCLTATIAIIAAGASSVCPRGREAPADGIRPPALRPGDAIAFFAPSGARFPVGHPPLNATLPHGGPVELDADGGRLRLLEDPVRAE